MTTTGNILDLLINEQRISEEQRAKALALAAENPVDLGAPWYIQLFMGFGAWLAATLMTTCGIIPFLITITSLGSQFPGLSSIFMGVILCGIATVLQRFLARSIFLVQLALAISLVGQGLFAFGNASLLHELIFLAAFIQLVFYAILLVVYPNMVHRIISTLGIIAALNGLTYDWIETIGRISIHLQPIGYTAIAAFLWLRESDWVVYKFERLTHPFAYGCMLSALVMDWGIEIGGQFESEHWQPFFLTPGIALITIVVAWMIMRASGSTLAQRLTMLVGLGIVALLTIFHPSIMLSLLILIVGYARGYRIVIGVGILSLVGALGYYFTLLPTDNVQRSLALIASGIVLLAVRFFLLPRTAAPTAPTPAVEARI